MNNSFDAIIIGGGVMGGSIAYNLSKRGQKVLLLEKERLASKASGAAAGMLGVNTELEGDSPLFPLAKKSRDLFPELAAELREISGVDMELIQKGMVKVALTSEQEVELKRMLDIQKSAGEHNEWLTEADLQRMEPNLSGTIRGGIHIPNDGHVSAPQLAKAFLQSAAVLGTDIREFVTVQSIEPNKVITNEGEFHSESIIVAAGAWSAHLLKLDTYPVKGECFSVKTKKPLLEKTIFSHGCYLVPKAGSRLRHWCHGKTAHIRWEGKCGRNRDINGEGKRIAARHCGGGMGDSWAGTRPQTGDGLPIIGEHPEQKGLFIATGHFRNGILLSPITGTLVADLVEGKSVSDLEPFRVDRYFQFS